MTVFFKKNTSKTAIFSHKEYKLVRKNIYLHESEQTKLAKTYGKHQNQGS